MIKKWAATLILSGGTILLIGCDRAPLTLDEVIDRNTKAMGGRAAIEAVQSIEVDLSIFDPKFKVDGIYRAQRPGRMRIDIMADGKTVYVEAFNGERAWKWQEDDGAPIEESPIATAALRHGVESPGKLFGLHEMQGHGHRLELLDRETIDGTQYYPLRMTFSDGHQTIFYVDPRSWLITRHRDVRPLHPDLDPTVTMIETRSADFRAVGGVIFAFISTDLHLATGNVLETTTVRSIKLNPSLDPPIFEKK